MTNSTRILFNTISQYFRTVVNVILALYATRFVLEALGANQYGIYTLVGGIVSMMSFFTNALTQTTQRYLSYNSSIPNHIILKSYFFNSLLIHLSLGVLLLILFFSIFPLLFSGFLNIAPELLPQAKIVFITIVLMLFVALLTSPFRATLISHENIIYLSIIDIFDGIFKLLIAISLFSFQDNRLSWYSVFLLSISFFNLISIGVYSTLKYNESKSFSIKLFDKRKIKELTSFAGWTMYGMLCLFGRIQGLSVVLNKFFGTIVNAAYGISLQVNSAIGAVSGSLQTAIAPQLIKAEGDSKRAKMIAISETGCKMSFFLISIVGVPIIFNMPFILKIWLGNVPEYASFFCSILIVSNIIDQLTVGFNSSLNAVGKIKYNHLIVNSLKLTTVIIIAILLYLNVSIYIAITSYVLIELVGCILRLLICSKYTTLSILSYFNHVIIRMLAPTFFICIGYRLSSPYVNSLWTLILIVMCVSLLYAILTYVVGLTPNERIAIKHIFCNANRNTK